MFNKSILVGALILIFIFIIGINFLTPGSFKSPKVSPVILEAFTDQPQFDLATGDYKNKLSIKFEKTQAPLEREYVIAYKNKNGEGILREKKDISEFAYKGEFTNTRIYKYPGEYTYTVILRNESGATQINLPTVVVE